MRKPALALAAACAMASTPFALAAGGDVSSTAPVPECDQAHARTLVQQATASSRWRRGMDRAKLEKASCAPRRFVKKQKAQFRLYREYRELTPYRCQRGKFGTWAIPCHVIACESGFSWSAYNPSGARGAYQFLGWDVPWPVRSFKDQIAHHRMARSLSLSNWVCA